MANKETFNWLPELHPFLSHSQITVCSPLKHNSVNKWCYEIKIIKTNKECGNLQSDLSWDVDSFFWLCVHHCLRKPFFDKSILSHRQDNGVGSLLSILERRDHHNVHHQQSCIEHTVNMNCWQANKWKSKEMLEKQFLRPLWGSVLLSVQSACGDFRLQKLVWRIKEYTLLTLCMCQFAI